MIKCLIYRRNMHKAMQVTQLVLALRAQAQDSWGGLLDTLRYTASTKSDGTPVNKFDKNGNIVGASDPLATSKRVVPYNNIDNFFRPAATYTNSLGMSGGSDLGTYYFSIANSTSDGIVPKSTFTRTSVRLNADANITSNLKASASVNYINSGGTRIQAGL